MFENIQKNLLEFIQFHEICQKFFLQTLQQPQNSVPSQSSFFLSSSFSSSLPPHPPPLPPPNTSSNPSTISTIQQLYQYFPLIHQRLEETLQQSKLLWETNIHCLAKITILQQEKQEMMQSYENRIEQLETQVASMSHALDHQKTLVMNYNSFCNLQNYWKGILHHATFPTSSNTASSTPLNSSNGSVSTLPKRKTADSPSLAVALIEQPALNRQQITEIEEICGKLLTWLSIDSYQTSELTSHPSISQHQSSPANINQSSLNQSLHQSVNHSTIFHSFDANHKISLSESFSPDQYKNWTQTMIQQVKKVKEYCTAMVTQIQSNSHETQQYHLLLKEQKYQKHRLYEKYLETERWNEQLQMQNEEFRMIANNHLRKIRGNEKQLRQLFDLLVHQKFNIQTHATIEPQSSRYTSANTSPVQHSQSQQWNANPSTLLRSQISSSIVNTQPIAVSRSLSAHHHHSRSPSPQRLVMPPSVTPPSLMTHQQRVPLQRSGSRFEEEKIASHYPNYPQIQQTLNSLNSSLLTASPGRLSNQDQVLNSSTEKLDRERSSRNIRNTQELDRSLTYSYSSVEEDEQQHLPRYRNQKPLQSTLNRDIPYIPYERDDDSVGPENRTRPNTTATSISSYASEDVTFPSTITLNPPSTNSSLQSSQTVPKRQLPLLPIELQQQREQDYHFSTNGKEISLVAPSSKKSASNHTSFVSSLNVSSSSAASNLDEFITLEKLAQF